MQVSKDSDRHDLRAQNHSPAYQSYPSLVQ